MVPGNPADSYAVSLQVSDDISNNGSVRLFIGQ